MAAVAVGDQFAFGIVYDRYADLVYSTTYRVLGETQPRTYSSVSGSARNRSSRREGAS